MRNHFQLDHGQVTFRVHGNDPAADRTIVTNVVLLVRDDSAALVEWKDHFYQFLAANHVLIGNQEFAEAIHQEAGARVPELVILVDLDPSGGAERLLINLRAASRLLRRAIG